MRYLMIALVLLAGCAPAKQIAPIETFTIEPIKDTAANRSIWSEKLCDVLQVERAFREAGDLGLNMEVISEWYRIQHADVFTAHELKFMTYFYLSPMGQRWIQGSSEINERIQKKMRD